METFTASRALVDNPRYGEQRRQCLAGLTGGMIDAPIIDVVDGLNGLPCCFTLQSCYGHFTCDGQSDPHNLEPLPATEVSAQVEYRIAYLALCVEDSDRGRMLLQGMADVPIVDPAYIQFGCAEWFWSRHVNSFALQVGPERFKREDRAILDYREALRIERTRRDFFIRMREMIKNQDR